MRVGALAFALGCLSLFSCADDEELPSLPCDVRSKPCQRAVFNATKAARGQSGAKLPPIRVITRKQLADELRSELDDAIEQDPALEAEQRQYQLALSLLGLMPPPTEQSSDEAYVEQSVASIAAYYSTYSRAITIISDQVKDLDEATITLSHELVHALQDQREDLEEWRAARVDSTDGYVASKTLTEGEATWLSYVTYYDGKLGLGANDIDANALFADMLTSYVEYIYEQLSAPLIAAEEMLPYPVGGAFVAVEHQAGGSHRLAQLFEQAPRTLREYAVRPPSDVPATLNCELPSPPDGYEQQSSDRLGMAGLVGFQVALQAEALASFNRALDWRGDRVAVYGPAGQADVAAIAWRIQLDTPEGASTLAAAASAAFQGRPFLARASGSEVLLASASDPAVLASWQPETLCGSSEKKRAGEEERRPRSWDEILGIVR